MRITTEKEMTIVVARAMKEELEQYEGVTVYLTRDGDQELSLDERCEFAERVGADFLFCLHFNMSGTPYAVRGGVLGVRLR